MTSKRQVVLSHPGCGPFVQQAARALHEAGLLRSYVTTFAYQPHSPLGRSLKRALRLMYRDAERQLARRAITEIPEERVITHPLPEMARMLPVKLRMGPVLCDLVWEPMELWFDRIVARKHLDGAGAAYCYEHGALETFRRQKERGGLCIYDMPTCHHSTSLRWMGQEFAKFPELLTAYDRHRLKLAARRNRRKDRELALADRVVAASRFVAESLTRAGVPREKIWVVPSGAPEVNTRQRCADGKKTVFLMAGKLSVLKGTHYLLEAWRRLRPPRNVELWLVGKWLLPERMRLDLPGTVVVRDTVPREELYAMFDRANVLVFPTLMEGLALTPLQAMARGLPVITTPNSGADIFIRDGESGWMVPPCEEEALVAAMERCCEDAARLEEMGRRAAAAMAAWQWSDYRVAMGKRVANFLEDPTATEDNRSLGGEDGMAGVLCGVGRS